MIVLVDMDGVLCDIESAMLQRWAELHDGEKLFIPEERTSFFMSTDASTHKNQKEVHDIMREKGFFRHLEPMKGAIQGLRALSDLHNTFIVTSAGITLPLAATEKYQWVEEHLGRQYLSKLIITPAKYMVKGNILIDDKPELRFEDKAEWEHILYDAPYNKAVQGKRRLTWDNWQAVLEASESA